MSTTPGASEGSFIPFEEKKNLSSKPQAQEGFAPGIGKVKPIDNPISPSITPLPSPTPSLQSGEYVAQVLEQNEGLRLIVHTAVNALHFTPSFNSEESYKQALEQELRAKFEQQGQGEIVDALLTTLCRFRDEEIALNESLNNSLLLLDSIGATSGQGVAIDEDEHLNNHKEFELLYSQFKNNQGSPNKLRSQLTEAVQSSMIRGHFRGESPKLQKLREEILQESSITWEDANKDKRVISQRRLDAEERRDSIVDELMHLLAPEPSPPLRKSGEALPPKSAIKQRVTPTRVSLSPTREEASYKLESQAAEMTREKPQDPKTEESPISADLTLLYRSFGGERLTRENVQAIRMAYDEILADPPSTCAEVIDTLDERLQSILPHQDQQPIRQLISLCIPPLFAQHIAQKNSAFAQKKQTVDELLNEILEPAVQNRLITTANRHRLVQLLYWYAIVDDQSLKESGSSLLEGIKAIAPDLVTDESSPQFLRSLIALRAGYKTTLRRK